MKLLLAVMVLVMLPVIAGATAGAAATAPYQAPAVALFSGVPEGGFANPFPYGQCTWWAAYNRRVTWRGDARDWLVNARAQGLATSDRPSVGAIAVYQPGGEYSAYGHVALVVAVSPHKYTVSEMNAPKWGEVSTRVLPWPDPQVQGFIPMESDAASPASSDPTPHTK